VSSLLLPLPPRRYPSLGGDRGREGARFRRARAQLPPVSSSTDSSSRGIADSRGDSRSRTTDREWAGVWERVGGGPVHRFRIGPGGVRANLARQSRDGGRPRAAMDFRFLLLASGQKSHARSALARG